MHSWAEKKVKSLKELSKILEKEKSRGKIVVQCHGVFDIVHPGHIRHFHSAKKEGNLLVVTLTADRHVKRGPGRPVFNEHLRAESLAALSVVDYVCVLDHPTAVEGILALKPNVYAKGPDYKNKKADVTGKIYEEERAVKSVGGRIAITDDITFSSSRLINQYLEVYPKETAKYLRNFSSRHSIESIQEIFAKIRSMKVLVIGDAIIDQYHYCYALGKSSKESIVVHQHMSEESFAGGAFATARHTAQIAGKVDLVTLLGKKNSFEHFIDKHLERNIGRKFFFRPDTGTTVKRRFVNPFENNKKQFEICYMEDRPVDKKLEQAILKDLKSRIRRYDLVIAADFGHGLLTPRIIDFLCKHAKKLAINVQTNSANIGFNLVTKYRRADLVCIDEHEIRLAAHDRYTAIPSLVEKIHRLLKARQVVVTRGLYGACSYLGNKEWHECPAFSYQVVDKVGAGDAFFAYAAPLFAAGAGQDVMTFVGNVVGSLAVQIVCNRHPVYYADLVKFMTRLLK